MRVAQGGTGMAASDDVRAIVCNPAGLAERDGAELTVSRPLHDCGLPTLNPAHTRCSTSFTAVAASRTSVTRPAARAVN